MGLQLLLFSRFYTGIIHWVSTEPLQIYTSVRERRIKAQPIFPLKILYNPHHRWD